MIVNKKFIKPLGKSNTRAEESKQSNAKVKDSFSTK